jgi:hypothetical protein
MQQTGSLGVRQTAPVAIDGFPHFVLLDDRPLIEDSPPPRPCLEGDWRSTSGARTGGTARARAAIRRQGQEADLAARNRGWRFGRASAELMIMATDQVDPTAVSVAHTSQVGTFLHTSCRGGAGGTRTHGRRIMSPLL